jgi:hypothetical protein
MAGVKQGPSNLITVVERISVRFPGVTVLV